MSTFKKVLFWLSFTLIIFFCLLYFLIARPSILNKQNKPIQSDLSVDPLLLKTHVKTLSQDFSPRDYKHLENLNASAAYIKNELENIGLSVSEQKYLFNGEEYKNIITSLGPKTGPKIIVGAHYDVAGSHPGADDNASGVAGLIELARTLSTQSISKNITLIAYTLEEPPIYATHNMGSYVHAKSEYEKGTELELMISLEMIGYFSDEDGSQKFPITALKLLYPTTGNFIAIIDRLGSSKASEVKRSLARNSLLPVHSINAPKSLRGIDFSDHRSYWTFDYPAVMITDTSFYRNTAYHTDRDTYERLDYAKMSELVRGLSHYLISISE